MAYHNEDIEACMNDQCQQRLTCIRWQSYLDGSMLDGEFYVDIKQLL